MRILFLLTQDLESPSGLGRYWPLGQQLTRLGHRVTIVALHSNYRALTQKRFDREGVNVWYVAPMHVLKQGDTKRYYSSLKLLWITGWATLALSRAALTVDADIIHVGKPHPMNGIAGWLAKIFRRRRVFLDCDDIETGVNRFGAGWQKTAISFFERWIPRWVEGVTTNTYTNQKRLANFGVYPTRIHYLANGVDPQRFQPPDPAKLEALRAKLGLVGKKVVGYLGSLGLAAHPVNLLVEAFAIIRQRLPESRLLLVGGGEDYQELQVQVQNLGLGETVIFGGRVPPEDVVKYYHLFDVSVDPVHNDEAAQGRLPLKLFESWICGVPFVSCDVGDRRTIIGDPPAGLLASPGNHTSLADTILQVLKDQKLAEALRQEGLKRVEAYYWEQLAMKLEQIYK